MNPDTEAGLLARCRRGDAAAWDRVFEEHYGPTSRFIFQLAPEFTREDAEEICQEVFLSVIRNIESFHGASRLQTWIFRIAMNKARDHRERTRAAKRGGGHVPLSLQQEDPDTGLTLDPPASAATPDQALVNAEKSELIGQAIQRLNDACREIIELRYFADLSYEEISKTLQLNQKTVSSRLSKCLDRLEAVAQELLAGEKSTRSPV